jgi:hypothetical protein
MSEVPWWVVLLAIALVILMFDHSADRHDGDED